MRAENREQFSLWRGEPESAKVFNLTKSGYGELTAHPRESHGETTDPHETDVFRALSRQFMVR